MCRSEELDLTYYFYSFPRDCVECNHLSNLILCDLKLKAQATSGTGLFIRLLFIGMESKGAPEDDIRSF